MDEKRKRFPEMKTIPGEDAVKIVEMITKVLKQYKKLVDKAVRGFESIDSNLEEVLLWVKCYQAAVYTTEKSFMKGRVN